MLPMQLEKEMESFLERIGPGTRRCIGAPKEEICKLDVIAGGRLPKFYRWFLSLMGSDPGDLPQFLWAYTCETVLNAYSDGDVRAPPSLLLVARIEDPLLRMDMFYDLGNCSEGDAPLIRGVADDGSPAAESLREWIGYFCLLGCCVRPSPYRCDGIIKRKGNGPLAHVLNEFMLSRGFVSSITTGVYCALFDRSDLAFAAKVDPGPENIRVMAFSAGASEQVQLRELIGELESSSEFEVKVYEWD